MNTLGAPADERASQRLLAHGGVGGGGRNRRAPTPRGIARRRILVTLTKWLLPVAAVALLSSIALWPEFEREAAAGRAAYRRLVTSLEGGRMVDAHYSGVDEKGRPYTLTASTAVQVTPERVNLDNPKGDVLTDTKSWLMLTATNGVYIQHAGLLDLSGDVTLYRDDGITLRSATASVDLKTGAALGSDTVSAEGPFGTLDATGYALVDKGAVIQFTGPARLVLNSRSR